MKNHWLKREKPSQWQNFTVLCDASGIQLLDGKITENEMQYIRFSISDAIIKEIMAVEDAKFMEAVAQIVDAPRISMSCICTEDCMED